MFFKNKHININIKIIITIYFIWFSIQQSYSQYINKDVVTKHIKVNHKKVTIDSLSISPYYFKVFTAFNKGIDFSNYQVDFSKATLTFNSEEFNNQIITVKYKALPQFLTKTYTEFNKNLIVKRTKREQLKFYELNNSSVKTQQTKIFNGLETTGFLSRGLTMGNNQDGVVNSGFKLQLKGKLSSKIKINANITDNTIPLTDNGYTQRLNEYDRIFVELSSNKWKLTGGDLFLNNQNSSYLNFNKKVAGLGLDVFLKNKKNQFNIYTSGAIVKGAYKKVQFNGQEANQGPYKLSNSLNQFLLIIAGSETVYINGMPLDKSNYTIDYSASEITFNTTYPINSDMRIAVEFQASEQNFTRFVSFDKVNYQTNKLAVAISFYSETDSKNKSLQQDLSDEQIQTLSLAGDDLNQMYTLSAIKENYIENKIQYKKVSLNGVDVFVFSTNNEDELYQVKFTYVGENQGDYIIETAIATGNIFKYIPPQNGIKQGNYEPKILLQAPKKLQITTFKAKYNTNKTQINTEIALSNHDNNLFSSINDEDNQGFAGLLNWNQLLIDKKWKLNSSLSFESIQNRFQPIEKIKEIEFDRSWNVQSLHKNQQLFKTKLSYSNTEKGQITYQLEQLNFSNSFNGLKHSLHSDINLNKTNILLNSSVLNSQSTIENTQFYQLNSDIKQQFKHFLFGVHIASEKNERKDTNTQKLNALSFKNDEYGTYIRIKDSLRTKLEVGYQFKTSDSIQNFTLQQVNKSNNYYLKSTIIQNKKANLAVYANYRQFTNSFFSKDKSINSKINYRQQLAANFIQWNTVYETSSGTIPQQEFNYLEVDSGKGFYTWNDYNQDGIQDLDEFEIAQFQDQATYVRVLLPSTQFLRTNQTKFNQSLTINPAKWSSSGVKVYKLFSHFVNQTTLSIDNKKLKETHFQFNPFEVNKSLELQSSFKNYLFFNRGRQHYSITYNYLKSNNKMVYVTGLQENNLESNQLQATHKINSWLADLKVIFNHNTSTYETYISRNLDLKTQSVDAKLSYLFNTNKSSIDVFFNLKNKNNNSLINEQLKSNTYGIGIKHQGKKDFSLNASFQYILNTYNANQNSPIAYQLMEGLQNGKNYKWNVYFQKKITNYLNINLVYDARKSDVVKTIHTGTIQLKAYF